MCLTLTAGLSVDILEASEAIASSLENILNRSLTALCETHEPSCLRHRHDRQRLLWQRALIVFYLPALPTLRIWRQNYCESLKKFKSSYTLDQPPKWQHQRSKHHRRPTTQTAKHSRRKFPARHLLTSSTPLMLAHSPPLTARLRSILDNAYAFAGLYFTTLFSTDSFEAAQNSPFSTQGRNAMRGGARASSWNSGRGSGTGSAPRTFGNSSGFGLRSTDHARAPGCAGGSCG